MVIFGDEQLLVLRILSTFLTCYIKFLPTSFIAGGVATAAQSAGYHGS